MILARDCTHRDTGRGDVLIIVKGGVVFVSGTYMIRCSECEGGFVTEVGNVTFKPIGEFFVNGQPYTIEEGGGG